MPTPTKPSTPKAWATDALAKLGTIGSAKQLLGFVGGIIPDAIWNRALRDVYNWINVNDLHAASYDTIEDAIDNMLEHGYGVVDIDPSTQYPGYTTGDLTGDRVIALDVDGKYAYLVRFDGTSTYTVERRALSDWSVADVTYTLSGTPDGANPVKAISTDGAHVGVIWGTSFDVFDVADGSAPLFTITNGSAPPSDCYLSGDQAHVFFKDGGAATSLVGSYVLPGGTAVGTQVTSTNSPNEGGICSDGQFVYAAYQDGTSTHIDVIAYDMSSILHTTTYTGDLVRHRAIDCNGHYIALGAPDGGNSARVFAIERIAGDCTLVQVGQIDHDTIGYSVCLLHDRVVISTSESSQAHMYVHALPGLELVGEFVQEPQTNLGENEVVSDGIHLFYPTSNASRRVAATCLGSPPTLWRKCSGGEPYRRPFHNLLIPGR